ncbi:MAG: hypothetical protein J1E84_03330 [Muribaculaceae bacterium]|nr:hypothetical protein [Muribaculaceae bacterium]
MINVQVVQYGCWFVQKKVEKCFEIAAKLVIIVLISKFEDAAGGGFLVLE